tara:strand:- start:566 stop:790 length:225 start_codon:yes stop_codon:yes gene_type:complete
MMTFYKCEIKKESASLVSVTVYKQQDSDTDWYQQYKRHCGSFDRAQEIAEQEQKARGATDYAWQTVIDTREAIQ